MNLWKAFKCSLLLPKRDAMFRLNRMGMGGTVSYLFILVFITCVPKGINTGLSGQSEFGNPVSPTLFILQFFVFYYLLFAFIMLIGLSILAAIGFGISKAIQRKLTYRQLWKMSAYAVTGPLLIYTLAESLAIDTGLIQTLLFLLTIALLFQMIRTFPKRRVPLD